MRRERENMNQKEIDHIDDDAQLLAECYASFALEIRTSAPECIPDKKAFTVDILMRGAVTLFIEHKKRERRP